MKLVDIYQAQIDSKKIELDFNQLEALRYLDNIKYSIELSMIDSESIGNLTRVFQVFQGFLTNMGVLSHKPKNQKDNGLYLYSDVGRGKTMLMDMFFNNLNLPSNLKHRVHFHRFIKSIHDELQQFSGIADPLDCLIKQKYSNYHVLCLDEFLVHDIADAMILSRVLELLDKYNIKLITTSNSKPELLYLNGLQREYFLPAINHLVSTMQVVHVDGQHDYRARMLQSTHCYLTPSHAHNMDILSSLYDSLNTETGVKYFSTIELLGRNLDVIRENKSIVWFEFNMLCSSPRSSADYLELAEIYKIIIVSGLYTMDDSKTDTVRRFINFIDVVYDYNVKLIMCSDASIDNIYIGSKFSREFSRTISRINEMQSEEYLSKQHL